MQGEVGAADISHMTARKAKARKPAKTVWLRSPRDDLRIAKEMFDDVWAIRAMIVTWFCLLPLALTGTISGSLAMRLAVLPAMFSVGTLLRRRNEGAEGVSMAAALVVVCLFMAPMIAADAIH
jgi:hypothetical protein